MSFSLKDQLYTAGCLAFDYFSSGQETTLYLEPFLDNEAWMSEDLLGLSSSFFDDEEQLISSWQKLPQEISWPFDFTVPYNQYVIFSLCDVSGQWDTEDDVMPINLQLYLGESLPSQVIDAGYSEEPDVTEPEPGLTDETGCSCDSQASTPMWFPMLWLFICLAMRRRV
jgi:hypothetical protein